MKKGRNTIKVNKPIIWTYRERAAHIENIHIWGEYCESVMFSILQGDPMYLMIPAHVTKSNRGECVTVKSIEEAKQLAEQICREFEKREEEEQGMPWEKPVWRFQRKSGA